MKKLQLLKLKNKILSSFCTFAVITVILSCFSITVLAESVGAFEVTGGTIGDDYSYDSYTTTLTILSDKNLTIKNTTPETPTTDKIVVRDGTSANLTLDGVNIDLAAVRDTSAFEIAGNATANITLADGSVNTLKSGPNESGLQLKSTTATLNITAASTGTLIAIGGENGAGIGSEWNKHGGIININGGIIATAQGGDGGAGIGNGNGGGGSTITINGGTITTAQGSGGGAGIGSGYSGDGGTITINGGTITTAQGGDYEHGGGGAGIGAGGNRDGGTITISNSAIITNANGGSGAAGIGGGYRGEAGTININSGTITATGGGAPYAGGGAGIGSGMNGGGGTININGGTITATGGAGDYTGGAGIGSGANSTISTAGAGAINISGGEITATGGEGQYGSSGAGIGGGNDSAGGEIKISGSAIIKTAQGGEEAAGIGGGANAAGGEIKISGSAIINIAQGGEEAAGIGGGFESASGTIEISGGIIKLAQGGSSSFDGGAGIGAGYNGADSGTIIISGGTITNAQGGKNNVGIGGAAFTTTATDGSSGNAFIIANGDSGVAAISDVSKKASWSGVIFEGNSNGKVYSTPTLATNAEIPSGKILYIEENKTLAIGANTTLTNSGTLTNNGTLEGAGTLAGTGTFNTNILKSEDITDVNNTYYYTGSPITVSPSLANQIIMGKNFVVTGWSAGVMQKQNGTAWNDSEVKDLGDYRVLYTNSSYPNVTKEFKVIPPLKTETDITAFSINSVSASIDKTNHKVTITMPFGTDVTTLKPTITVSEGASINPASLVEQDFTNPVTYKVTAEDTTITQDWTVTVTVEKNNEANITAFTINGISGSIDKTNHKVTITMPFGTDVTTLKPTITVSEGASINPASLVEQDFTNPVTYKVTAEDTTITQDWTVTVAVEKSNETNITAFTINGVSGSIDKTNHRIAITMPVGTDVTTLKPTIALSSGASITPASLAEQDFTNTVNYTVTAEDGTTKQEWAVTVMLENEKPIITHGENQTIPQGSSFTINSTGDFDFYIQTEVKTNDGKTQTVHTNGVDNENASAVNGSTIVTLSGKYTASLPLGTHSITIVNSFGNVTTNFTIVAPTSSTTEPTTAISPLTGASK